MALPLGGLSTRLDPHCPMTLLCVSVGQAVISPPPGQPWQWIRDRQFASSGWFQGIFQGREQQTVICYIFTTVIYEWGVHMMDE